MIKVHKIHEKAGEVMTLRHFTNKVLTLADVSHVSEHQKRLRKSMGLKEKVKFSGNKRTRLEVIWKDSSCTSEHFTVGRFRTAEECMPHVMASSRCGKTFMIAPGQFVWGCRCCDSVDKKQQ